ncbi:hypothetical protein BDV38DRAFT_247648 [Aspergillus pseudotamarii]|uniref:Secreted protein n=1 Tax=Aspergillus pseudotamarii TaxID=132259 RepID=A0A5N6STN2_ASPPS|nr:uncharacterized protein BDV38DRAFT_247648 [Aspergillus pseudotamarii]KAE8137237.1 hypothetical protein BDV38DRAFT_247648 [Aspergillus pseudotamarii]
MMSSFPLLSSSFFFLLLSSLSFSLVLSSARSDFPIRTRCRMQGYYLTVDSSQRGALHLHADGSSCMDHCYFHLLRTKMTMSY